VSEALVVAVSGATGHLGGLLARRLAAWPELTELRTLGRRPMPDLFLREGTGTPGRRHRELRHHVHLQADVRSAQAKRFVAGCDLLYHLAAQVWVGSGKGALEQMRQVNVEGTASLAAGAGATVLASSVVVYGAWPDNPLPLTEDWPARPNPECGYALQKLAAEHACADVAPSWTAVRLSAVLGSHADVRVLRALAGYRVVVPSVLGCAQALQWLHEQDAVEALVAAGANVLRKERTGLLVNAATADWLGAAEMASLAGSRVVAAPRRAVLAMSELGRRARLSPFGADRAVLIGGPLAVSIDRAGTELGWRPRRSSREVLVEGLVGGWRQAPRNRLPAS
jgi:nucleoside-diphosphate-sugar epimerase